MKMKQKILLKAVDLFNEHGFVNVRVRDISGAMGVSPGSISYHYRNKEDLLFDIYKYMLRGLHEAAIAESLVLGVQFMEIARVYAEYVYKFRFFFQDTLEIFRAHPRIAKMHQKHTQVELKMLTNVVYLAIGNGTLVPEPEKGLYAQLCEVAWMTVHFWFVRGIIMGTEKEGIEKALLLTAKISMPYFTERGKLQLEEFTKKVHKYSSIVEKNET